MGLLSLVDRALCLTVTVLAIVQAHAGATCNAAPTVLTQQGPVSGFSQGNVNVFLGIPFAQTTGGENRWKAPQPLADSTTAKFDATSYGPSCAQAMSGDKIMAQSEDCLNLNVRHIPPPSRSSGDAWLIGGSQIWTPANGGRNLPVFVYIYGGAMVTGGNSNAQWQGHNFARKDVIYVNVNYRESVYASPNAPELKGQSQNFGILDVDMALEWVYKNIHGSCARASNGYRR